MTWGNSFYEQDKEMPNKNELVSPCDSQQSVSHTHGVTQFSVTKQQARQDLSGSAAVLGVEEKIEASLPSSYCSSIYF